MNSQIIKENSTTVRITEGREESVVASEGYPKIANNPFFLLRGAVLERQLCNNHSRTILYNNSSAALEVTAPLALTHIGVKEEAPLSSPKFVLFVSSLLRKLLVCKLDANKQFAGTGAVFPQTSIKHASGTLCVCVPKSNNLHFLSLS